MGFSYLHDCKSREKESCAAMSTLLNFAEIYNLTIPFNGQKPIPSPHSVDKEVITLITMYEYNDFYLMKPNKIFINLLKYLPKTISIDLSSTIDDAADS